MPVVLAGDIGGTKTDVGLFEAGRGRPRKLRGESFASRDHPGLLPILDAFLAGERGAIAAACFGVAGPVRAGRADPANLQWTVDAAEIAARFSIPRVELVNDLAAMAGGLPALAPNELAVLHAGTPDPTGNAAVVAAGTGLGVAILAARDGGLAPVASEGGHGDFAAGSEEDVALWRTLHGRFGHVSVERVVSGPGLVNIFEHLRESTRAAIPPELDSALAAGDPAPVIAQWSANGRSALCAQALAMFLRCYGGAAGNVALIGLATRGVFLGGGIAPKLLEQLRGGEFMDGFRDKGRYRKLMESIPVSVILNPETALLGAAARAIESLPP